MAANGPSRRTADSVEFTQELTDPASGYAYLYRKTVRLTPGKPQLVLEHSLTNTGKKSIDTTVYDHNFFPIDGRPIGPGVSFTFPFDIKAVGDIAPRAEVRGKRLVYLQELEQGKSVATEIEGFRPAATDYDIRLENAGAGAGVRITGDHPLSRIYFWSIRATACVEPYIAMRSIRDASPPGASRMISTPCRRAVPRGSRATASQPETPNGFPVIQIRILIPLKLELLRK